MADCARIHLAGGWASFIGQQEQNTTNFFLAGFSVAFTIILEFLQLKYQGQNQKGEGSISNLP